ncbi:hypothetical protein [Labedella endophytica]|uniref:Transcriptional regulator, AbiEi antitoxin, Type IV TA system n=1 Tax=Labedella endophytica TaxID=1523160 RepID=A0A3S1CSF7_9MICO|nr:hypothetical protein [Labedella endophytica]RUR01356.1 hypothetical protein ELQ94_07575 [Labedella endophytica]
MEDEPLIIRRRDRIARGDSISDLDRSLRHGELLSVAPGAYIRGDVWRDLDPRARHRLRVLASLERLRSEAVLCHFSAAAHWGLDIWQRWPSTVDILVADGGRSSGSFRRHSGAAGRHETVALGDFRVTTVAQTAVDIALVVPFHEAVVTMDSALRLRRDGTVATSKAELLAAAERMRGVPGSRRAASAANFATHLAESPLESVSRVRIMEAGFPEPRLQEPFSGADGFRAVVDFWWPDFGVIGEADGRLKYGGSADSDPQGARQAVIAEKNRENTLRRLSSGFARWEHNDVVRPGRLSSILLTAGLRTSRRSPY